MQVTMFWFCIGSRDHNNQPSDQSIPKHHGSLAHARLIKLLVNSASVLPLYQRNQQSDFDRIAHCLFCDAPNGFRWSRLI